MRIVLFLWLSFIASFMLPHVALSMDDPMFGVARGFIWDVRQQDVLRFEKAPLIRQEEDALFYAAELYKRESTIGYAFIDDKLSRIRIDIHQHYTNPQDWIDLLADVKLDLSEKWGEPLTEEFIWHDEKERNFPDNWGVAVMIGDLDIRMQWVHAETVLTVTLKASEEMRPAIGILYEKHAVVERQKAEESEIDPLLLP